MHFEKNTEIIEGNVFYFVRSKIRTFWIKALFFPIILYLKTV